MFVYIEGLGFRVSSLGPQQGHLPWLQGCFDITNES